MANKENKVKYNLRNVHYAVMDILPTGEVSYRTPVPIPGAVSLSLDPSGEPSNFYADGYAYYVISNNMGYSGDLEIAMVPDSFRKDVLREVEDRNKVLIESARVETVNFALLFEFDGDVKAIRHVMYYCTVARPSIQSQTNEESVEVRTDKLTLKAAPLENGLVKAKTGTNTEDATYQSWYRSVYMPDIDGQDCTLSALSIGSLTLDPTFAAGTTTYTADTTNATDVVNATPTDNIAAVTIKVNGTAITSGSSASWEDGENIVAVTVLNGMSSKVYTVTVNKS